MFFLSIGTTGRPKGVTLSHSAFIVQSLAKIATVGYGEDDVCISSLIQFLLPHFKSQRDVIISKENNKDKHSYSKD